MARVRSQYGFFPAAGTDYSYGQEPQLAARLNRLAQSLRLHLVGISGYRTPAHSVEVGGFANDPHTRGQASDTPGVESVPEATLRRFGLTRPFGGAAEADHIQLLGGARGSTTAPRQPRTFSLADLWTQAGGPRNLAPLMAAIAMAESGGRVGNVSPQNSDGSYDYGLWQINSSHTQFDQTKLISDPLYNARAAVAVWRSQGLGAWTTYTSGAYRAFTGQRNQTSPTPGRVRPGGEADTSNADISAIFADYTSQTDAGQTGTAQNVGLFNGLPFPFNVPGDPLKGLPFDPLKPFNEASKAVSGVGDFLKFIAWIFHPINILRAVEFVVGGTLMVVGLHMAIEAHREGGNASASKARSRVGKAVAFTPAGRAVRVARGARAGRKAARATSRRREFNESYKAGRARQTTRQKERQARPARREADRKYGRNAPF